MMYMNVPLHAYNYCSYYTVTLHSSLTVHVFLHTLKIYDRKHTPAIEYAAMRCIVVNVFFFLSPWVNICQPACIDLLQSEEESGTSVDATDGTPVDQESGSDNGTFHEGIISLTATQYAIYMYIGKSFLRCT